MILSDDLETLDAVLPSGCCQSDCEYYLHVAELFKKASMSSHEVHFLQLALSVWPEGGELDEVSANTWASIIKGYSDLGLYEDAYCYLISSPHQDQYVTRLSCLVSSNLHVRQEAPLCFKSGVQNVRKRRVGPASLHELPRTRAGSRIRTFIQSPPRKST